MKDLSLSLLRHGYDALDRHRPATETPQAFSTRLLGRRYVVVTGERGARLFYDEDLVARSGAVPPPLAWLLFGRGAIHGLDGEEHRARKRMFLDPLEPEQVASCAQDAGRRLEELLGDAGARELNVHGALVVCFGTAVLDWAGVELAPREAVRLSAIAPRSSTGLGLPGLPTPAPGLRAGARMRSWLSGSTMSVPVACRSAGAASWPRCVRATWPTASPRSSSATSCAPRSLCRGSGPTPPVSLPDPPPICCVSGWPTNLTCAGPSPRRPGARRRSYPPWPAGCVHKPTSTASSSSRGTGSSSTSAVSTSLVLGTHHERSEVAYFRARRLSTVDQAGEEFWVSAEGEIRGPERRQSADPARGVRTDAAVDKAAL